ncbi:hypothetical protein LOTGIDRAFT_229868 [Lottia gigantea]|uniref:Transmembrane protein 267 n=1 Tax=Lottia gigantea TaxID=225164 RepID=V3ZKH3_LOTGI|nr:hypothetical protein LOTGIDRAFT_229868 [Lottia gigantea]ESO82880.1 hypothetical protein LOTGIDRAFT_229868 [Lottia gigantea]
MKILDMNILALICYETCLVLACLFGDTFLSVMPMKTASVKKQSNSTEPYRDTDNFNLWKRSFVDSLTHGLVGLFSWAIVINFVFKGLDVVSLLMSFVVAVSIDLDHFLAAKSLFIQDALSLSERPPFHASTIVIILAATCWLIGYILHLHCSKILGLLFLSSGFSHHIRDGWRRGLWFPPLGSTQPIPYNLYIVLILILPLFIRYLYINTIVVQIK